MDEQNKYKIKITYDINKFYYKYVIKINYNKWKDQCETNKSSLYNSYEDIIHKCKELHPLLKNNIYHVYDDIYYQNLYKMIALYNTLQEEHIAMFENIRKILAKTYQNFNNSRYIMPKHIISLEMVPLDIEERRNFFILLEINLQHIILRLDTLLNLLNL